MAEIGLHVTLPFFVASMVERTGRNGRDRRPRRRHDPSAGAAKAFLEPIQALNRGGEATFVASTGSRSFPVPPCGHRWRTEG
jgi:hypothetical protein